MLYILMIRKVYKKYKNESWKAYTIKNSDED